MTPTLTSHASSPLSLPLALAASSSARPTEIHAPRPGALARTSGPTWPSGPSASRIRLSRVPLRRVSTHVRSGTFAPALSFRRWPDSFGGFRNRVLLLGIGRGGLVLVLEPVRARGHDDLVALL